MAIKNIARPAIITLLLLLIPAFGMRLSNDWNWNATDFIVMGGLIFGTGLLIEYINRKINRHKYKIALIVLVVIVLLIAWIHFAVGIVDTWPLAGS